MGTASIDYLDAFQVSLCTIVIVAIGYLCGGLKMFNSKHASEIRRALYLICIPGLVFRLVALQPLSYHSWSPFLNSLLVQATMHIIYALVCLIFPFKNKSKKFLEMTFATTTCEFLSFASSCIQYTHSLDYIYVPTMQAIALFAIVVPFHTVLSYVFGKPSNDDVEEKYTSSSEKNEEDEIELEEGIESGPAEPIIPVETQGGQNINDISEPRSDQEPLTEKKTDSNEDSSVRKSDDANNEEPLKSQEPQPKKLPLKWALFWTIVNSINVCTIVGIIWSATKWEMIVFVEEFTLDLQKTVFAAGLFINGVIMWEYPFKGFNWMKVLGYNLIHYIIMPLVSMLWCYVCKVDKTTSILCVLSHVSPVALFGNIMARNSGYKLKTVPYTFFWSNVAFLPIYMLWVIVFNEISIFSD